MKKNNMKAILSLACAATLAAGVGVFTMNNASETVNADTAHTEAIFMANGASIRYSDPSGIRFIGYVSENVYTEQSVVGMTISVGGIEKDFSTANAEEWKWAESDVEGYKKFQVAITRIPDTQYGTEMTAQAYVDGTKSAEIVTRSIANVANAALAANTLEETLTTGKVTALESYVNDNAVALPFDATEVSVQSGKLTFDAVENAKGYLVQFGDEITNIPATEAETYSVPVGDFEGTIKMLPYGDGINYTYAATAFSTTYGTMIEDFNDAADTALFTPGTAVCDDYQGKDGTFRYGSAATWADGVVTFTLSAVAYKNVYLQWNAVTVDVPAIDLSGKYDGISVKFCANWFSQAKEGEKAYFYMTSAKTKTAGYTSDPTSIAGGAYTEVASMSAGTWQNFYISNAQLAELGYETGDTKLVLMLYRTWDKCNSYEYGANISIDSIQYFTYESVMVSSLKEGELANFNNFAYATTISAIAGDKFTEVTAVTKAPAYSDGMVTMQICADDYRGDGSKYTGLLAFNVTLPKAIDLNSGYNGIVIKMNINSVSHDGPITLELLNREKQSKWHNGKSTVFASKGEAGVKTTGEMELYITNAQLAEVAYATGDTILTFGLRYSDAYSLNYHKPWFNFSIDYIKYYDASDLLGQSLAEGELANFNEAAYTSMLSVIPGTGDGWKTAPTYADGKVSFGVSIDEYRTSVYPNLNTNIAPMYITLPKALDLDNGYDGIKIRVYVSKVDNRGSEVPTVRLEMFAKDKNSKWLGTPGVQSEVLGDGTSAASGWLELFISNEQLAELGYKTGDTVLTFGFRTSLHVYQRGYGVWASIDYINYYKGEI